MKDIAESKKKKINKIKTSGNQKRDPNAREIQLCYYPAVMYTRNTQQYSQLVKFRAGTGNRHTLSPHGGDQPLWRDYHAERLQHCPPVLLSISPASVSTNRWVVSVGMNFHYM